MRMMQPAVVIASLSALAAGPAAAGPYTALYVFGDSLSDGGNAYLGKGGTEPVSPPYAGVFSNGPVWAQDLSQKLGLGTLKPSLAGGTDFAVGGAQTGTTPLHTAALGDLPSQLTAYQAAVTAPQPHALYSVWIGANDLSAILADPGLTQTQISADVAAAVNNVATFVKGLAADGAKNLLLMTVPDLGVTPDVTKFGPAAEAAASALSKAFDTALLGAVGTIAAADGIRLFTVDTYSLLDSVVAHPTAFGFSNATAPCWTGSYTSASSGTVCANPASYVFWDGEHPTAAAHAVVADAALAAVPEPASLGLFAIAAAALLPLRRRRTTPPRRG